MKEGDSKDRPVTDRESAILRAIVYEYIFSGKAVGSRSFVQKYSFSISPATMRNIMYDLELMGYLMQPHTSAGRIPTDKGYRFYVNSLLDTYEFETNNTFSFKEEIIRRELQLDKMFCSISKMLSLISCYAGVVLTPIPDFTVVKHVEVVPLDNNEILFILVTRTGMIITKKIVISTTISQEQIYKNSKYLTSELSGYSLFEIKMNIFEEVRNKKETNTNENIALDIAELALSGIEESDLFVDGIENLLHIPEMIETDRLKSLLHLIEEKKILINIMGECIKKEGVYTQIGEEIERGDISGCSIVTSPYRIGKKRVGAVGILGPTRMDYDKVVPLVDCTSRMISDLLTKMSK